MIMVGNWADHDRRNLHSVNICFEKDDILNQIIQLVLVNACHIMKADSTYEIVGVTCCY